MTEKKLKLWKVPLYYHRPKSVLFVFAETEKKAIKLIKDYLIGDGYDVGEEGVEFGYPESWDIEKGVIDLFYDE